MQPTSTQSSLADNENLMNALYTTIGGAVGFLASYPVSKILFTVSPTIGLVSGLVTTGAFIVSGIMEEMDDFNATIGLVAVIALQAMATYAIGQYVESPITFTAAFFFPVVIVAASIAVILALNALGIIGEKETIDVDEVEI